ncbi:MAG: GH92 family glycosyl hydrolase [Bacteroidota bacterium]|nr:GH92 family glycosyl hydrolase [Bacteroidota bacterium]
MRVVSFLVVSLFLSAFSVFQSKADSRINYAQLVDTRIGTEGNGLACGFTFLGAAYPFGMMQLTPSFFSPQKGIVVNQISGAGCPNMGNFPVLPLAGDLKSSPQKMETYPLYETVNNSSAGYCSITMKDGVTCRMTVSKRSGIIRFLFPDKEANGTILIGSGVSSTFVSNAQVKITSPNTCEGYAKGGEFCGYQTDYKIYFAASFNRNANVCGTWINSDMKNGRLKISGKNSGAYFTFDTQSNQAVEYKVAISYVSVENARENLRLDNKGRDFETVRNNTENEWNRCLSKIDVQSSNKDRLVQFYTNFYHSMIHPNLFSDINGEYIGSDQNVHKTKDGHDDYTTYSGWDTYRTQSQLIAMLFPKESSDMMQSVVDFAEQSGGYGRWVLANIEAGVMQGDPIPIIISNTYAFGGRDFDVQSAYKYMKCGATVLGAHSQDVEVRPGLDNYIKKGVEGASLCLEYASSDYAIGQFALQALKNKQEANYFIKRAGNWKNLYDPSTNWLRSRQPTNMSWKDPNSDWREATKENYFWMVPFDLKSLIDTMGGKSAASKRLDSLFVRLDAGYDDHYFAAGNEPDFQVPWIYNWTDKPYKTSEVIYRILNQMYTSNPKGLPGNDDCGSLGAWYVFASIGLYPMVPGVAGFSMNTPQFESIKLTVNGKILEIKGGSETPAYISSMKVNGNSYTSTWIDWSSICQGGSIDYEVDSKP